MSDAHRSADDTESRKERKERYEKLLRTVELNTGDPQPPGARRPQILGPLVRAGHPADKVKSTLQAAIDNDDILENRDHEGRRRYARTTDDALMDVITAETDRDHPNKDLIGTCNQLRSKSEE